jgi:hypothetical protein
MMGLADGRKVDEAGEARGAAVAKAAVAYINIVPAAGLAE